MKKGRELSGYETLRPEYEITRHLHEAVEKRDQVSMRVLEPAEFVTSEEDWYDFPEFPANDAERTSFFSMTRVPALQTATFCPDNLKEKVTSKRADIARVCLGRRSGTDERTSPQLFFSTYNFPLYIDRCEQMGLPVDTFAAEMGQFLAIVHFLAQVDGRDMEIVLGRKMGCGSGPLNVSMKAIDFNQVCPYDMTLQSVPKLVAAVVDNLPYFPTPKHPDLYKRFSSEYLKEAQYIAATFQQDVSPNAAELAEEFIRLFEAHYAMQ
ncbi:hypothetical protein HK102_013331 [Quaeritorhiza haematococci]|nr:hypothetical protein HK102_013331 [Quaeritorhiza haematococci]